MIKKKKKERRGWKVKDLIKEGWKPISKKKFIQKFITPGGQERIVIFNTQGDIKLMRDPIGSEWIEKE